MKYRQMLIQYLSFRDIYCQLKPLEIIALCQPVLHLCRRILNLEVEKIDRLENDLFACDPLISCKDQLLL